MVNVSDTLPATWSIRKGLVAPIMTMGTEPTLIVLNVTLCVVYVLATRLHWPALLAPLVYFFLHTVCVLTSRADPRMIATFRRAQRYRGYFPSISGIYSTYTRPFSAFPDNWWQA